MQTRKNEKSFCARGKGSLSSVGFPLEKSSWSPGSALECSAQGLFIRAARVWRCFPTCSSAMFSLQESQVEQWRHLQVHNEVAAKEYEIPCSDDSKKHDPLRHADRGKMGKNAVICILLDATLGRTTIILALQVPTGATM
ncbi:hypothetical protein EK904_009394 [Melospiza melodia maxima]|nr:hypothetical protein EK904_009394 [Melospiza melodia maxima]